MTDSLASLAARTEMHADALRTRAARLVSAAATAQWQSLAAQRFRSDVEELARHLRAVATCVDSAAAALRRHASAVHGVEQASGRVLRWLEGR